MSPCDEPGGLRGSLLRGHSKGDGTMHYGPWLVSFWPFKELDDRTYRVFSFSGGGSQSTASGVGWQEELVFSLSALVKAKRRQTSITAVVGGGEGEGDGIIDCVMCIEDVCRIATADGFEVMIIENVNRYWGFCLQVLIYPAIPSYPAYVVQEDYGMR